MTGKPKFRYQQKTLKYTSVDSFIFLTARFKFSVVFGNKSVVCRLGNPIKDFLRHR